MIRAAHLFTGYFGFYPLKAMGGCPTA